MAVAVSVAVVVPHGKVVVVEQLRLLNEMDGHDRWMMDFRLHLKCRDATHGSSSSRDTFVGDTPTLK